MSDEGRYTYGKAMVHNAIAAAKSPTVVADINCHRSIGRAFSLLDEPVLFAGFSPWFLDGSCAPRSALLSS